MYIVLHIERLVFDGIALSSRDRAAVHRAVSAELSRLLASGLRPEILSGSSHAAVKGRGIAFDPTAGGSRLGGQVARAVHGGIGVSQERVRGNARSTDATGTTRGGRSAP